MHVVRHGNIHRIQPAPLLVEQFPPVGVKPRARNGLGRFIERVRVHVA